MDPAHHQLYHQDRRNRGGSVGVTTGLGFQDRRFDFNYGGHLTDHTRFFIGDLRVR